MQKGVRIVIKRAFTLTELLLAIAIVGVIAVLVLPASVSKFNDKLIDNAYDRLLKSINTSLDTLSITENRSGFMSTMMYVIIDNGDYEYTSGKFLKKYLRVAKYCGNSNGKCFADKYYEYKGNKKLEFSPTYKGGCAVLKSGASICLEPQVGANAIKGLIDINGPKGPNVLTRDLREITISPRIHQVSNKSTEAVITTPTEIFNLEDTNICETNPESLACCETLDPTEITAGHTCCTHFEISSTNNACSTQLKRRIILDVYCSDKPYTCFLSGRSTLLAEDGKYNGLDTNYSLIGVGSVDVNIPNDAYCSSYKTTTLTLSSKHEEWGDAYYKSADLTNVVTGVGNAYTGHLCKSYLEFKVFGETIHKVDMVNQSIKQYSCSVEGVY